MNNTVYDIDFTRALPLTLKDDEAINALGRVIAAELQENIRLSRFNILYPQIDELEENLLDILAYDLHIDWYDPDSPPDIKRAIIKDSVRVHKRMGTKYAVESVVTAYFGSGEVREWYEYGGQPHHFKVISGNPSLTDERATQFFRILDIVKRKSSWLDTILITLTGGMNLCAGVVIRDANREANIMGSQDSINVFYGALLDERATETHAIGKGSFETIHGAALYEMETEKHTIKGESN